MHCRLIASLSVHSAYDGFRQLLPSEAGQIVNIHFLWAARLWLLQSCRTVVHIPMTQLSSSRAVPNTELCPGMAD